MNIRLGRRISIYFNKVAKVEPGDILDSPPWHGYYYGSYPPKLKFQKSSPCYCLDISWLMYFSSIYWNR